MKKLLIVLSSFAVIISLLAGCSNSSTEEENNTNDTQETQQPTENDSTGNSVEDYIPDPNKESETDEDTEYTLSAYKIIDSDGETITALICNLDNNDLDTLTASNFVETSTEITLSLSDYSEIIPVEGSADLYVDDYIVTYINSDSTSTIKAFR